MIGKIIEEYFFVKNLGIILRREKIGGSLDINFVTSVASGKEGKQTVYHVETP